MIMLTRAQIFFFLMSFKKKTVLRQTTEKYIRQVSPIRYSSLFLNKLYLDYAYDLTQKRERDFSKTKTFCLLQMLYVLRRLYNPCVLCQF